MNSVLESVAWGLVDPGDRDAAGELPTPTLEQLQDACLAALLRGDDVWARLIAIEIAEMVRRTETALEQQFLSANAAGLTQTH